MTAPQDPNSPATAAATTGATDADDEVVDGELVENSSGTLAAGDDPDDPADISDAEISNDEATETRAAEDKTAGKTDAVGAASHGDPDVPAGTESAAPTPAIPWGGLTYPTTPAPAFDYTDAGVPTLSYVQDKIEKRLGTAQGSTELNESRSAGKQAADQQTERERLAKARLDEIRQSVEGH
ncbi:MAG: hypothetical protein M3Y77_09400 [Actinomycetota bacterium]|nr:hypothetical protein [Actinomycetota bacterium]